MIYLLDANVLIAMLDQDHVMYDRAHHWFERHGRTGWATCPLTENAVLRILGHPRYPKGPGSPSAVAEMLRIALTVPGHEFWPDEISLLSAPFVNETAMSTPARVTDTYLLALAVHRAGALATFDRRLSATAVQGGAGALHLIH